MERLLLHMFVNLLLACAVHFQHARHSKKNNFECSSNRPEQKLVICHFCVDFSQIRLGEEKTHKNNEVDTLPLNMNMPTDVSMEFKNFTVKRNKIWPRHEMNGEKKSHLESA